MTVSDAGYGTAQALLALAHLRTGNARTAEVLCKREMERHRDNVEATLILVECYHQQDNHTEANRLLEALLCSEPTNAEALTLRAKYFIDHGKSDKALDIVEQLVEHTSHDTAFKHQVTHDDREFGRKQLRQLLLDRPQLAVIDRGDRSIYSWISSGFAGGGGDGRIHWIADEPVLGILGFHVSPTSTTPASISIAKVAFDGAVGLRECTRDEQLGALVFEMLNVQNASVFHEADRSAMTRAILRDDYCLALAKAEYITQLRTRAFFVKEYLPWAKKRGINTSVADWNVLVHATFEWHCMLSNLRDPYPFAIYGAKYDLLAE